MLEKIRNDLNRRLAKQSDSRQASHDEVSIAWLISEIDDLSENSMKIPDEIQMIKFYEFRKTNPVRPIVEIWQEVFGSPANKALERDLKHAGDV